MAIDLIWDSSFSINYFGLWILASILNRFACIKIIILLLKKVSKGVMMFYCDQKRGRDSYEVVNLWREELRSVVLWLCLAVEFILEKSKSTIDFLIEFWDCGLLFYRLIELIALILLLWEYCPWFFSASSLFWIFPFLVEGLSNVFPKIVREAALSKVL